MSDRLTYEEFCEAADKLFYEDMVMPTADKTLKMIQHGSKSTHQLYLRRWQDERKRKPATLEEALDTRITQKFKEFLGQAWNTLEKSSDQKIVEIKQESEKIVQNALLELKTACDMRDELIKELTENKLQLETLSTDNQLFKNKLIHEEKLRYAAEESNKSLQKQLLDLKESHQQQLNFVKQQYNNSEQLLKEQLKEISKNYEIKINQHEVDRKKEVQHFNIQIEKYKSDIKIIENRLHENISTLDKKVVENNQLIQENQNLISQIVQTKKQIDAFKQLNNNLEMQSFKKDTEIEHLKNQLAENRNKMNEYEKELRDFSIKVGILQEKLSKLSKKKKKNEE